MPNDTKPPVQTLVDARGNYLPTDHPLYKATLPPVLSMAETMALWQAETAQHNAGTTPPPKIYTPEQRDDMAAYMWPMPTAAKKFFH